MTRNWLVRGSLCIVLLASVSCDLFRTTDSENVSGTGVQAFNPYAASGSGAIKLALQFFNGCAVLPNGEALSKGTANIPYPATCANMNAANPTTAPSVTPRRPMPVIAGTTYFLNQFGIMDMASGLHRDFADITAPTVWMRNTSRLKNLDWEGLGLMADEWIPSQRGIGLFDREVLYGNANWMQQLDDTFLVEVLDSDGNPRTSQLYSHRDFLAENALTGHTRVSWRVQGIGPPQFFGDTTVRTAPASATAPPPGYQTYVKVELYGSTNPFKSFTIDQSLSGDGAIRLTWSQLPDQPFYFPVTFVRPEEVPLNCYAPDGSGTRVACGFGVSPGAKLNTPANGRFYVPGETVSVKLELKDADGNFLHPEDSLPSFADFLADRSNGILYVHRPALSTFRERDITSELKVAGPLHNFKVPYGRADPLPYFAQPQIDADQLVTDTNLLLATPGLQDARPSTRFPITLPADAEPGTYVAQVQIHRQFMGERDTKTTSVFFQVGQDSPTHYPGRIGNCQICHRGAISLDNVRHGMPVTDVEGCKTCHATVAGWDVHRIHSSSPRYPRNKADCSVCHLSRESAIRPSFEMCSSCHASPHGTQFFMLQFAAADAVPSRFGNCAQTCHGTTLPSAHVLPAP